MEIRSFDILTAALCWLYAGHKILLFLTNSKKLELCFFSIEQVMFLQSYFFLWKFLDIMFVCYSFFPACFFLLVSLPLNVLSLYLFSALIWSLIVFILFVIARFWMRINTCMYMSSTYYTTFLIGSRYYTSVDTNMVDFCGQFSLCIRKHHI